MLSYSLFNRQPIRPIEGDAGTRIGEESRTPNRDAYRPAALTTQNRPDDTLTQIRMAIAFCYFAKLFESGERVIRKIVSDIEDGVE